MSSITGKDRSDWLLAEAVIVGCRPSWSHTGDESSFTPGEYVVTFAYEVRGRSYNGWYYAGSPRESGKTFGILYDPLHPERNTGSEYKGSIWMRATAWSIGIALAGLILWLKSKMK